MRKSTLFLFFVTILCSVEVYSQQEFTHIWSKSFTESETNALNVTPFNYVISDGSVYVAGTFTTLMDVDPGPGVDNRASNGGIDAFVVKLDLNGNFIWGRTYGGTDTERVDAIEVDASGNVIIGGLYRQTVDFDPGAGVSNSTSLGSSDQYVLKLDQNGNYLWHVVYGNAFAGDGLRGIKLDNSDNLYVYGVFNWTVDFDPGPGVYNIATPVSNASAYVLKLDPSGNFILARGWIASSGGSVNVEIVKVEDDGRIHLNGNNTNITVDYDLGPGVNNNVGGPFGAYQNYVYCMYDASFNLISKINSNVVLNKITDNYKYWRSGVAQGVTIDIDPGAAITNYTGIGGAGDQLIVKTDLANNYLNHYSLSGPLGSSVTSRSINVNNYNELFAIFSIGGNASVDFDNTAGIYNVLYSGTAGGSNLVLIKTDPNLSFLKGGIVGVGSGTTLSTGGLGLLGNETLYITGNTSGTQDFDPQSTVSNLSDANINPFIAKYFICSDTYDSITVAECGSYTAPSGMVYTTTGIYNDTILNSSGCDSIITIDLTIRPLPLINPGISVSDNTPCAGDNIIFTAPFILGVTYSWSGPNGFTSNLQNPSISNVGAASSGVYTLIVTDGSGCTSIVDANAQTTVTVQPLPVINPGISVNDNTPCAGSTLSFNAPTNVNWTYSWSGPNGFTSSLEDPVIASVTTAASGTYTLVVTDNTTGCSSIIDANAQVTVSVQTLPVINPAVSVSDNTPCVGDNITFSAPSNVLWSYSWNGPNSFSSTSQFPSIFAVTAAASGTYTLTVTHIVSGCTSIVDANAQTTVTVQPLPVINPGISVNDNTPCAGSTLSFNAPTNANWTYSWSGPNGFTSSLEDPMIPSVTTAASGTYTLIVTDNTTGCSSIIDANAQVAVTVQTLPAISTAVSATDDTPCVGDDLQLNAQTNANWTYSWSGPNGFTSSLEDPMIPSVTTAASGTYTLVVTDNTTGCSSIIDANAQVAVTVQTLPVISTAVSATDDTPCVGDDLQLNAQTNANWTYSWFGPDGFASSLEDPVVPSVTITASGVYVLYVTDNTTGCTSLVDANAQVDINVQEIPVLTMDDTILICNESTAILDAGDYDSFNWSTGETTQQIEINSSGWYSLEVTMSGCSSAADSSYVIISDINAQISGNTLVCYGDDVVLIASPVNNVWTYSWTGTAGYTNANNEIVIQNIGVMDLGLYTVTIADTNGCESDASVTLAIDPNGGCFDLPEIITPNGDGLNETFIIDFINEFPGNSLSVYNRYGTLVYSASPYQNDFNGESNTGIMLGSGTLPNSTYVYILELGGDEEPIQGILEIQK